MATMKSSTAFDLSGKTALVTGSTAGIGKVTAELLAAQGARLVLVSKTDEVHAQAREMGQGAIGFVADVQDEEPAARIVADAVAATGGIDILVNNAGIARIAPAVEQTVAEWDETMAVNLRGAFVWAREVGKAMIARGQGGRIVNIASQAAIVGLAGHAAYCASKAGMLGLTKVLALEWGPYGITVNAVLPTVVLTELGARVWAGQKGDEFKAKIPTGRFAEPDEIAMAVLYLASGAAGMINGHDLVVDGGYTIA